MIQVESSNWKTKSGVLAQALGDEVVLLDINSGVYYTLNPTGARAWQLLRDGHALPSIKHTLLKEFDVTEGVLEVDLARLFKELHERELIEPLPAS